MRKRRTYNQRPKIIISKWTVLILALGLTLIAISCKFLYDFLVAYKSKINETLFYVSLVIVGCFAICLIATTIYFCLMLYIKAKAKNIEADHTKARCQSATINNRLAKETQKQMEAGLVYLTESETEQGRVKFRTLPKRATKEKLSLYEKEKAYLSSPPAAIEPVEEISNNLIEDTSTQQRLMLVGGQGVGKTTLLQHIAAHRAKYADILILDSHCTPDKWDSSYRLVGHGRNYKAIQQELVNLVSVMDARYKELASGKVAEGDHSIITVISDEWTTLSKNVNNLEQVLLPLLTESRKVCIDFILATHSETAGSLGIKGMYDLKENFDAILRMKNINGDRLVDVFDGKDVKRYYHAGAFIKKQTGKKSCANLDAVMNNIVNDDDQIIIDSFERLRAGDAFSWSKLCVDVYGKKGGKYVSKIKKVLDDNNIDY